MTTLTHNPEEILAAANERLARMLGREPLSLATGAAQTLEDSLWVWGVLGGKEVGKSTLINALAGSEVAPPTEPVGEGTFRPAAIYAPGDEAALRDRLADLQRVTIDYRPAAAPERRGLVLVDLPDFDSLFVQHIEQVRQVARVLDGIIWVTTPKKVGDLRAIEEIQRVLKSRTNFVYVINKIDWLLAQSDGAPQAALERTRASLAGQIAACNGEDAAQRTFLISARHPTAEDMLAVIAHSRDLPGPEDLQRGAPQMGPVVGSVVQDFQKLQQRLTAAPSAEDAEAHKRANLGYQIAQQTRALREHFRPDEVLERLGRDASQEAVEALAARNFTAAFCLGVARRLLEPHRLVHDWSGRLFRQRVSNWPLLGLIAWPLAIVGALIDSLRNLRPVSERPHDDPFRADGLGLEDRAEHLLAALHNELAGAGATLGLELPSAAGVARHFRAQAAALAGTRTEAAIAPFEGRRPTVLGRLFRWLIPISVLLWFPLLQPVLAAGLAVAGEDAAFDWHMLALLVTALSAQQVLLGLLVSGLILAVLVAAIYSGAVRDAHRARDHLVEGDPQDIFAPLLDTVVTTVRSPLESFERELSHTWTQVCEAAPDS